MRSSVRRRGRGAGKAADLSGISIPTLRVDELDPSTPVIVGVGQAAERIDDADYAALGEADLAARAVAAAFADAGAETGAPPASIDVAVAVRSFEKSSPASHSPFGRPDNMPRAVAARTGMDPRRAVEAVTGGQSPQHLVNEFGAEIAAGRCEAVVLFGAEIMSTVRHAQKNGTTTDFSESIGGQLEDRGYSIGGLTSVEEVKHGVVIPISQYSIVENARRHRLGASAEDYARSMGEWLAPMSTVAAENPYSAAPEAFSAEDIAVVTPRNRRVSVPYTRRMVARDHVNQAAAVVLMSVAAATAAGIPADRWVFLHGHADTRERPLLSRPDLSRGPASTAAVHEALRLARIGIDDLADLDLYSCFPVAVSHVCEDLGLEPDDPRGLTVTGGLPYFGGPGNNYSMHAIAEIVARARRRPGSFGLVAANGGVLSKYSVGVYSTSPVSWRASTSAGLQRELDTAPTVAVTRYPNGPATIESFVVIDPDGAAPGATVVGRLDDGSRFVATADDPELVALLSADDDPIGTPVFSRSGAGRNHVALTRDALDDRHPRPAVGFAEQYEHLRVRRDGHILEVTIDRPEARNAMSPVTNAELDAVFDAYFADPDLWVAILTGAGDKAFSAGNDLGAGSTAGGLSVPANGFAGLTTRRELPKPVIAAVNGYALGGGLEVALACHLIVADEHASFGLPEVRVGLAAAAGGLVRLPRVLPPALARDMILTGRRLDAAQAAAHGLVSRVAAHGEVMDTARGVARELLAGSPIAVRASLSAMAAAESEPDAVRATLDSMSVLDTVLVSEDFREGLTAFAQKREPEWKGR
ncbi:acetyl-CoA acetyltransferase [Gordonia neofelifaecis]|uniref:Probable enoyl-CoA hydratase EchA17 n=1 Tax=Gordonia neofelifaecis NRRL B-59395 TaxID=644548 RepID=F1YEM0_9ACTN|nr:acetyl-CoA acetyltransferase [Gordonia neofelifaecis]EGD56853.1 enoyl-CoA hydratase/isomerase [Gordonia neofelifaecis NRRL B-59395]